MLVGMLTPDTVKFRDVDAEPEHALTEVSEVALAVITGSKTETETVRAQPTLLVYVMDTVPEATPVTVPVVLAPATVATEALDVVHGDTAAGVAEPVRAMVPFLNTDSVPLTVGRAFTVPASVIVFKLTLLELTSIEPFTLPTAAEDAIRT